MRDPETGRAKRAPFLRGNPALRPNGFGVRFEHPLCIRWVVTHGTPNAAMETDFPRIHPQEKVRRAVALLLDSGWPSGLVVDEDGTPSGVFGRREVLRALSTKVGSFFSPAELGFACLPIEAFESAALCRLWRSFWDLPVSSVMDPVIPQIPEEAPLAEAARKLASGKAEVVIVLRDGRAVGALRTRDLLATLADHPERVRGKRNRRPRSASP